MKILVTFQGYGGVQRHRIHDPFQHIKKNGYADVQHTPSLDNLNEEGEKLLEQFDVVVFNRNISHIHQPDKVFAMLKRAGVKIVIDLDDYWELPKHHVAHNLYKMSNLTESMIMQMAFADMVWVTHERLGKEVNQYNTNWHVIPNAIDPEMFPDEQNEFTDVHFYQGSVTHKEDLRLIKDMDITVCGNVDGDTEWDKIRKMMPNARFEDAHDASTYHELYWNKGICVIPLKRNKFNMMKSNLKMLEAGWYKKPVVVRAMPPYIPLAQDKKNAILVKDGNYQRSLNYLKRNPSLQEDIRHQLHEDIRENYMMDQVNKKRMELLQSL